MAFEFRLSTAKIRDIMYEYIKPPKYKDFRDAVSDHINWIFGVYDTDSSFYITEADRDGSCSVYVVIINDNAYYLMTDRSHTLSEIPDELIRHRELIQDGIKFYNNEIAKMYFEKSLSREQKEISAEIYEKMTDKRKHSVDINSYEDAERLFRWADYSCSHINKWCEKNTVQKFDQYMSEQKMREICGKEYREILSEISACDDAQSAEDRRRVKNGLRRLINILWHHPIDALYEEEMFNIIRKNFFTEDSVGGTLLKLMEDYFDFCIRLYPDKIQALRLILDFMNENPGSKYAVWLEFYRKELDRRIYNRVYGYNFVLTTDKQREIIYNFLNPECNSPCLNPHVTGIDWISGVYDKERQIFLTKIYDLPDRIARSGIDYHSYIIITDSKDVFRVDNNYGMRGCCDFKIPEEYEALSEGIKKGIEFYESGRVQYESSWDDETRKRIDMISSSMCDRCRKNFPINCEEDARRLFVEENCNERNIRRLYNNQTVTDFFKYATWEKSLLWRSDHNKQGDGT